MFNILDSRIGRDNVYLLGFKNNVFSFTKLKVNVKFIPDKQMQREKN